MLDKNGFDSWADSYNSTVKKSDEEETYPFAGYKEVISDIYKIITLKNKASILDIGFGTGNLTRKLYENGYEIFGQDFSEEMINISKENMPRAQLYQGDFSNGLVEELRARNYDFIIGTYSFHHLENNHKINFIKDLLDLLKEDGKIIIGDVIFKNQLDLEKCKDQAGKYWDEDEIYIIVDDFKTVFPNLVFKKKSFCSGLIVLEKN